MKLTINVCSTFRVFKDFTLTFKLGEVSLFKTCFSIVSLALISFSAPQLFAQPCTSSTPGTYGLNSWNAHVYKHNGSGSPAVTNPFVSGNYIKSFSETEVFDRNWGSGSPECAPTDNFSIRYKMKRDFPCGKYRFEIGGDDGMRLSIDGGQTWLVGNWADHSYTTETSVEVQLGGSTDLVLEFYERWGVARLSFKYSYTALPQLTGLDAGNDVVICSGEAVVLSGSGLTNSETMTSGSTYSGSSERGFTNGYYDFGYSRHLYRQIEIGGAGNIKSIQVFVDNSPNNYTMNGQKIYLKNIGNTQSYASSYNASTNGWVNPGAATSGYTHVYDNSITFDGSGWMTITFTTPFYYSGNGSLELFWVNTDSSFSNGYPSFSLHSGFGYNCSVRDFKDGNFPTSNTNWGVFSNRYWTRFVKEFVPTYSWSGGPIVNGANTLSPTVNPTSTTTYTLTADLNGCKVTDEVVVKVEAPGNPALFGDNVWNVYGYNGNNTNLDSNIYRGFYKQPDLGGGNYGVNTLDFWSSSRSPSFAGKTNIDDRLLWNGCDVKEDIHSYVHKRKGFPCGNYRFEMTNWDDETRLFIDGAKVWSCGVWSGNTNGYSNTIGSPYSCPTTTFTIALDADSEVEFQTFEGNGGSNLGVKITQIAPTSLANNPSAQRTCYVKGNDIIYFLDETTDQLIAAINPNGENLGRMTMESFVEPVTLSVPACDYPGNLNYATATLKRHWVMHTENTPSSAVTVYLPFRDSEYSDLVTAANGNPNPEDNIITNSDLKLTKYSGPNENNLFSDNCGNGNVVLQSHIGTGSVTSVLPTISNSSYAAFSINSFSEFWLHGQNNNSALPVKLTNFSASCDEVVSINWTTASEQNSDYFVVEKSRDGQNWVFVAEQNAAGNSSEVINYTQLDENISGELTYYRLRQIDYDGKEEVFGPISVSCDHIENGMKIFPNPNDGSFTIEILSSANYSEVDLLLNDVTGKLILSKQVNISEGTTQIMMNNLDIRKGAYFVSLQGAEGVSRPIKVILN